MSSMNQIASDLYKSLTESNDRKPKPYDTKAEVLREDGNIVWVKIPGGIDETPVQKTNNAKAGDTVMVRVSGGRAWLLGNNTSPATDDTRANLAYQVGTDAGVIADIAIKDANRAQEAANYAETEAIRAQTEAGKAQTEAGKAKEEAEKAKTSADISTVMLSEIEKVVDVLTWIAEHGTYKLTNDTEIIGGKLYFTLTGSEVLNPDPNANPSTSRYYELNEDDQYVLSTDTQVDQSKTYYTVTGSPGNPVSDPKEEGFYELNEIDSAVSSYISTHLILDNDGLKLTTEKNRASYLLLTPEGGMQVYRNGRIISEYGERTVLGDIQGYHIEITGGSGSELGFYSGQGEDYKVAYINGNQLYIPQVVVVTSMQVGDANNGVGAWRWSLNEIGTMGLYWIGGVSNGN